MSRHKAIDPQESKQTPPPALTLEGWENRIIAKTMELVERRIDEGTASSQEVTHFLKLGSSKAVLERDKLREENKLLRAKTEALKAQVDNEALLDRALKAFRSYRGEDEGEEDEYPDVY